jgi:hypothetical protein
MKGIYLFLFATCLLVSCTAPQPPASAPAQQQWTKAGIVGLTIELIDPVAVESMTFSRAGLVPLTVGRKHGPVTKPVFYWELAPDGFASPSTANGFSTSSPSSRATPRPSPCADTMAQSPNTKSLENEHRLAVPAELGPIVPYHALRRV